MKNKLLFVISFTLISATFLSAQEEVKKDTINIWVPQAVIGLNISQIALSNWTQGGENALAWVLNGNGSYNYIGTKWNSKNSLKFAYGRTKLGSQDFRTNDNEIYLENLVSRNIGWAVDPYFSNTIRTPVTKGFDYDQTPAVETANFFDPGYITQSIGFTYDKLSGFSTRIGFAVQEVITSKHTQYADDPETAEIEKISVDTGIESVTKGEYTLAENLLAKTTLRLFSRFENLDVWDVRWDNSIVAKINDFINVNLSVLIIYEKKQSLKTQIKEALQLGIVYTIL